MGLDRIEARIRSRILSGSPDGLVRLIREAAVGCFCEECFGPLRSGAGFCQRCGHAVTASIDSKKGSAVDAHGELMVAGLVVVGTGVLVKSFWHFVVSRFFG